MFKITAQELIDLNPCKASKVALSEFEPDREFTFKQAAELFEAPWLVWTLQEACKDHLDCIEEFIKFCGGGVNASSAYQTAKNKCTTNKEKREFDQSVKDKLIEMLGND